MLVLVMFLFDFDCLKIKHKSNRWLDLNNSWFTVYLLHTITEVVLISVVFYHEAPVEKCFLGSWWAIIQETSSNRHRLCRPYQEIP